MSFAVARSAEMLATLTLRGAGASTHAHHASHLSAAAVALAVLGAVAVLACVAWALARHLDFDPRWYRALRHSLAEAAFRTSATWSEFGDWLRLGR